ncbi:MAG TPA: VOC family protein [Caulobacteraceae bacterium]|jgi:uncharacterized glyoxalase superfamily protein PhnB
MTTTTATVLEFEPAAAPEVRSGVVPYLNVADAAAAAEFYKQAFGAEEVARMPAPGSDKICHLHLYVNGGSVMLSDPFPEHGCPLRQAQGYNLHIQVYDVDRWYERAVDAGAEVVMPLQLMFWGDRYAQLRDPFGVTWSLGGPN